MPGLIGFSSLDFVAPQKAIKILHDMQQLTLHDRFYHKDEVFVDASICGTRSHLNILKTDPQPYSSSGYQVWLDGEFYNSEVLQGQFKLSAQSDVSLLLSLYQKEGNFSFLKQIDGIYAAVLYDSHQQKLHLISDRYGMRRLYWTVYRNSLVWSSELKALLALPEYTPTIDRYAIEDFLGLRYLMGDRTWFEGVELLPAATVLTWDLQGRSLSKQRYWWWDEIAPLTPPLDERELAEELGRLFVRSVERRSRWGEKVGLTLSGGLDSRAILAAMPDRGYPIEAVTLGQPGCQDLQIAERVAKVKKAHFNGIEMTAENWLMARVQKVWETDGSCSMMHMQLVPGFRAIEQHRLFEINLHGAGGDGVVGGDHLFEKEDLVYYLEKRLGLNAFARSSDHKNSVIERFREYFQSLGHSSHILYLDSRIRSFLMKDIWLGIVTGIETRLPFLDNQFEELLYSIPNSRRQGNSFYETMLILTFPTFYKRIPRQGTGLPIGRSKFRKKFDLFSKKIKNRIHTKLTKSFNNIDFNSPVNPFYRHSKTISDFQDTANWMRQEPARSVLEEILIHPSALYPEYISREQVQQDWSEHLKGNNRSDKLGLTLTLELWLQQVFAEKYRQGDLPLNFKP